MMSVLLPRRVSTLSILIPVSAACYSPGGALPRALPRARSITVLNMDGDPDVKVTIRKRSASSASSTDEAYPAAREASPVFVATFTHVKPALATFLKFWLMGGCGAEGWAGTGELEAQHTSGTKASIQVDAEQASVTLVSQSAPSSDANRQLNGYAVALLDELESLAKTEEAAVADRLCYPPEAVDSARLAAWAALAPRESDDAISDEQASGAGSEFQKFLQSLKK